MPRIERNLCIALAVLGWSLGSAWAQLKPPQAIPDPAQTPHSAPTPQPASGGITGWLGSILGGGDEPAPTTVPKTGSRGKATTTRTTRREISITERVITNAASSAARTVGTQIGKAILRGVLGSLSGGKR